MAWAGRVECESGKDHHSSHNILQEPLPNPYSNRPRPLPTEGEVATTAARASAHLTGQLRVLAIVARESCIHDVSPAPASGKKIVAAKDKSFS